MMMTNVKLFQILRFANDKRFQNFAEVVDSGFDTMGYSERCLWGMVSCFYATLPLPYDDQKMEPKRLVSHKTSIYLRAPSYLGKARVFCALVPSLVGEVWIFVDDVWNLIGEVQNLVASQTVW